MWRTIDPEGREVVLVQARWDHVLHDHPELATLRDVILEAVRRPTRVEPGRDANESWFLLAGVGPSRWLHVVVHYEQDLGRITTAFARRSLPTWL